MYWVFEEEAACIAANDAASVLIPPDISAATGLPAPIQVTTRWADPRQTIDGLWAIPAHPGMGLPQGAVSAATVEFPALADE